MKSTGQIKIGDSPVGISTKATVIKNRMGPPMRGVEFNIFFDRGIDGYSSWLETLIENKVIRNAKEVKEEEPKKKAKKGKETFEEKKAKAKVKSFVFTLVTEGKDDEVVPFEKKDFPALLATRPEVEKFLYDKLCEICIMKYKSPDSAIAEDIDIDESAEGLDSD